MIEHHRLAGLEVRRQPAEAPNGVDRPGEAGQQLGDALARHDAAGEVDGPPIDREREKIVVFGELPCDREVAALDGVAEQGGPVFRSGDGVERSGPVSGRVQAADDAAHAGAGEDVH